ncbi:hypothetical protein SAMN02982931_04621 [Bauldia litoralis]|uniref:Uncharacterized protein n=1 Tax=Bauldia litoralis TaxID=665467 RepID=A0A1G6EKD8_9HYPH|nr:hypothetical protein SAMN02982931_04621 [Bauldia litoralis]
MAELTATTVPSVSARIVKRTLSAPRYSVRIGVGSTAHGTIEPHRWRLGSQVDPSNIDTNAWVLATSILEGDDR